MYIRATANEIFVERAMSCSFAWTVVQNREVLAVFLSLDAARQKCCGLRGHDCGLCSSARFCAFPGPGG